jgi:hypothetical protein
VACRASKIAADLCLAVVPALGNFANTLRVRRLASGNQLLSTGTGASGAQIGKGPCLPTQPIEVRA